MQFFKSTSGIEVGKRYSDTRIVPVLLFFIIGSAFFLRVYRLGENPPAPSFAKVVMVFGYPGAAPNFVISSSNKR